MSLMPEPFLLKRISAAFFILVAVWAAPAQGDEELSLGAGAPDFHLTDVVSGKTVSRDDFADKKALLVIFICRHLPLRAARQEEPGAIGAGLRGPGVGHRGDQLERPETFGRLLHQVEALLTSYVIPRRSRLGISMGGSMKNLAWKQIAVALSASSN